MSYGSATAAPIRIKNNVPARRFRYHSDSDDTSVRPGTGACHSSDIPAVCGTTEFRTGNVKDSHD